MTQESPSSESIAPNIWKWCKSQTFIVLFLEWLGTQTDFTAPPHYLPCSALLFPYRNSSYSVSVRQIPHILSFIRSCHLENPPQKSASTWIKLSSTSLNYISLAYVALLCGWHLTNTSYEACWGMSREAVAFVVDSQPDVLPSHHWKPPSAWCADWPRVRVCGDLLDYLHAGYCAHSVVP